MTKSSGKPRRLFPVVTAAVITAAWITGLPSTPSGSVAPMNSVRSEDGVTPAGGGGGTLNNEVVVVNTTDGRFAQRSGFGTARVTGDTAENQNAAAATSSCSDCRTVAVAAQIVLIQRTDATTIAPRNLAIAINQQCFRCETFAAAYQYVVTTSGIVRFTAEGQQQLTDLQGQIRALAATDGIAFPELEARISALVAEMWTVVDHELVKVGVRSTTRALAEWDQAVNDEPVPSPSPSETVSPAPVTTAAPEDSATPQPAPTSSAAGNEESPAPSSEPSESPSSEPSESPSPTESTPHP